LWSDVFDVGMNKHLAAATITALKNAIDGQRQE
jgi:hypothetical protein